MEQKDCRPSTAATKFVCGRFVFVDARPLVMGIVNLTSDSFSGDGVGGMVDAAIYRARLQIAEGADILDLGAESSRPGATSIAQAEEIDRLVPVVTALRDEGVAISVDTCKPAVMAAVLDAGADMINDIGGFSSRETRAVVRDSRCGVCAMHMRGTPQTMQVDPVYGDVVEEVKSFLGNRIDELENAGVEVDRVLVDPGFGFGKQLEHNVALFKAIRLWTHEGWKVLIGVSRKSMLGQITGRPVEARQAASIAAAMVAAQYGARVLRVHDVGATRDALAVLNSLGG